MQGVLVHKTTSKNNAAPYKHPARHPHSHYFGCLGRAILRWLLAQTQKLILLQGSSNQAKQARISFLRGLGISVRSQAWEPTAQARQLGKRVYQAFHRTDPAMAEALVKQSQNGQTVDGPSVRNCSMHFTTSCENLSSNTSSDAVLKKARARSIP